MRRVVITGLGVISPIGIGKDAFWTNALEGRSGAISLKQVTCCDLFGQHDFSVHAVCEVADFTPTEQEVPPTYRDMDRYIQFALQAGYEAFCDAKLHNTDWERTRTGISLATAICGTQTLDREFVRVTKGGQEPLQAEAVSPHLHLAALGDGAARAVAMRFGLHGPCHAPSTGCIGGLDAIAHAYALIKEGRVDRMLAGATEAPITPVTIAAFGNIHCLSRFDGDPRQASRPFTRHRDGFVLGEGAGILVLEELEHALARQATIYAELVGFANTQHAQHMTDMGKDGLDLGRAMMLAMQAAGLTPEAIDFVNAHGTSTQKNDVAETQAIKQALGAHAYTIPVNSLKSMTGHALGAASAIEAVACVLSIWSGMLHPTINLDDSDPMCDLDYVPNHARKHAVRWLVTDACGFGGLQVAGVMGAYHQGGSHE